MRTVKSGFAVFCVVLPAVAGLWLMNILITEQVAGASPLQLPQTTVEPTAVFSATVSVAAEQYALNVNDQLTVIVDLEVSEGCQYPVYNLTLKQATGENAILEHVAPATDTIGPPVYMPSTWTFRAIQQGTATLEATLYGETFCGNWWQWRYLSGKSESIYVMPLPYNAWIPTVSR